MARKKPKTTNRNKQTPATINKKEQAIATLQSFSGPLPHPELFRLYDEIIPGAGERILAMAEQEAEHQHHMENMALDCASKEAKRGQWFGLIIGVCAFASAIIAVLLGSEKTAMVIGGTTVVGLVTAFVVGRKTQPQNTNDGQGNAKHA